MRQIFTEAGLAVLLAFVMVLTMTAALLGGERIFMYLKF